MIHGYSSPLNLGHKEAGQFFDGLPYLVQEKVDGSQFSFGIYGITELTIACRSRGQQIDLDNPGMFDKAVETVKSLADKLVPYYTYRGEYLRSRKHNALAYDRVPEGHIVLFDIDKSDQKYATDIEVIEEAERLGLDFAPYVDWQDCVPTQEMLNFWLDRESVLGGVKIEGVVLKNYRHYTPDKKSLMVKYVSSDFREIHSSEWKKEHPTKGDVVTEIIRNFGSEARWNKVIQHLRETNKLEGSHSDIGLLLREFNADFEKDCVEEIKEVLWKNVRKDVMRGVSKGLPDYYKDLLVKEQIGD